jgi:hypothetical protein
MLQSFGLLYINHIRIKQNTYRRGSQDICIVRNVISTYQNKVSYIKLLKEFNCVTLASMHNIRFAFLYKTVNGVLDNSAFLEQLNFSIRKGNLCTRHLFSYSIPKTEMYKNLPLFRICNVYNSVAVKYPEPDFSLSFVQYLKLLRSIFMS